MATPTYPSTLPSIAGKPTEVFQDTVVRTPMEQGPMKLRRRYTSGSTFLTFSAVFTAAERNSFITFWRTEIDEGATAFLMTDPNTNTLTRFRMLSMPSIQHLRGDGSQTDLYRIQFQLEKLP